MGVWSLRDPGSLPREIERLGQLRVGEVSEPLDSVFGFEILTRTEVTPRPHYAATAVTISYDASVSDEAKESRTNALHTATALAAKIRKDPSQFESLQRTYCCAMADTWTFGRGPVGLSEALDPLKVGEIASAPVESTSSFLILKRLDPATVPEPAPVQYELPSPRGPDFDVLMKVGSAAPLAEMTRRFAREIPPALSLEPARAKQIAQRLEHLAEVLEKNVADSAARVETFHATLSQLKADLGAADFEKFKAKLDDVAAGIVMRGGA
jgi:hypothetical protein